MRVYLDNCCYNRPYDDQTQLRISLESQAKLAIQARIKNGDIELATSYMTFFENSENPYDMRRKNIRDFQEKNATVHLSAESDEAVNKKAVEIEATGIKHKDACHVACAIYTESDYLLTTDDRLLKYETDEVKIMNPIEFIQETEED